MKICFFLDNKRKNDIDFSEPQNGNPGIGGTEFMIWTISYYLNQLFEDINITLLAPTVNKLPQNITKEKCEDICEAIKITKNIKAEILVVRSRNYDQKVFDLIDKLQVKTIMWSHNFETNEYIQKAAETKFIKRNLCVSREQLDRLMDHKIYIKSSYIYNALDFSNYPKIEHNKKKGNIVCYVGAIKPAKGFDVLAKYWGEIEKIVPNAQLYVIGGANLYDSNIKLGKYGIAEEDYEKKFIGYLIDENQEIKQNIKFWGVLGEDEKIRVMSEAKVGVINPIAKDETFCISAVEFEALGIPVIGRKRFGLLDTIDDKNSGILIKSEKELVKAVTGLLNNDQNCLKMGKKGEEFVRNKFNIYEICQEWRELFNDIINDKEVKTDYKSINFYSDLKWLRELNRMLKKLKCFNSIPAILEYPNCIYSNPYYKKLHLLKNKMS